MPIPPLNDVYNVRTAAMDHLFYFFLTVINLGLNCSMRMSLATMGVTLILFVVCSACEVARAYRGPPVIVYDEY